MRGGASRLSPPAPAEGSWRWGLFPRPRLFVAWGACVLVTGLGLFWGPLLPAGLVLATAVLLAGGLEYAAIGRQTPHLSASRSVEPRLSLGDDNLVRVRVANGGGRALPEPIRGEARRRRRRGSVFLHRGGAAGSCRKTDNG